MLVRTAFQRISGLAAGRRCLSVSANELCVEYQGSHVEGFHLRNQEDFRVFVTGPGGKRVSPWHDIPLYANEANGILNFVNEIPRGSVEKMEVATKEELNPIKQDVKKDKLRLYPFVSLVNYGCLPQTWEDPEHKDETTGYLGDNDPVDVVEIGGRIAACGEVYPVKLLGILGMIDEGEMDWKAIAIDVNDPLAASLNSVSDLESAMPGKVQSIVEWFKYYKVPDGKPVNEFAFEDKAQDATFAHKVVSSTHKLWSNSDALKKHGLWTP